MRGVLYILSTLFFMVLVFAISGYFNGIMYVPYYVGGSFVLGSWLAIWIGHFHFYHKHHPPSD